MKIKKNDIVIVISGEDKGKTGKVLSVDRKKSRLLVEGVNFVKRHRKARRPGDQSGILEREAPIHVSNVMLYYDNKPTKVGHKELADGKKVRVARKTGEVIG
ncbi:MAG: 50S ribosomal protein L24 [Candidatus Eisenbacteria bacterium]|nr:50S ribosomal protein L24 [Candidatus Eisenbacteria bacterium]